ncbi:MAG: hypothetical protein VX148_05780 [Pseudomonadota bacterium]|nr:hypothetical protein [Pseudomonadota bacterium]
MKYKTLIVFSSLFIGACSNLDSANQVKNNIPQPESWSFPQVIYSALKIAPTNIEGRPFNKFGLAYPLSKYSSLDLASLPLDELQKYADVVTYAYPDAISRRFSEDCSGVPLSKVNAVSLGGMAYVSNHAVQKSAREKSLKCFTVIQERLKKAQVE